MHLDFDSGFQMSDLPPEGLDVRNIIVRTSYALWPGEEVICVRVSAPKIADTFVLLDKNDRRMELRVFRYGMQAPKR